MDTFNLSCICVNGYSEIANNCVCESTLKRIVKVSNNHCVCQDGYFENNLKVCVLCDYSCLTCNLGSKNDCLTCDSILHR